MEPTYYIRPSTFSGICGQVEKKIFTLHKCFRKNILRVRRVSRICICTCHYILVKHRFRNSVKDVQTLPGADTDSDHNLLVANICTRLKKIIRSQKRRPQWDLEKLYTQRQRVQDTLEEKLGAIGCDSGNVEVQWNNIKECVLNTISYLVGEVKKRARKPLITQEMIPR